MSGEKGSLCELPSLPRPVESIAIRSQRTSNIRRSWPAALLVAAGITGATYLSSDCILELHNQDSEIAAKLRYDELVTRIGKSIQDGTIAEQPLVSQDEWPQVQRDYQRMKTGVWYRDTVKSVAEPFGALGAIIIGATAFGRFRRRYSSPC